MKKAILLASLLITQASFAKESDATKVNECFTKMTALTDSLIESGVEEIVRNGYGDENYHRSTEFNGTEPSGKSCRVSIEQSTYPDNASGDIKAHSVVYVGIFSNDSIHIGFSMNTYYDYLITGIPGGASRVNFKIKRCDVDLKNLNAKVTFSSTGKDTVQVTNRGNGILDFKTSEDASGILGLFVKESSLKCTVDLNNQ